MTVPEPVKQKEWGMFWRKSELQKVLLQGYDPAVDIASLLHKLDETPVKTRGEAEVICDLLKLLPARVTVRAVSSRLYALAALFQDVETKAPFGVLAKRGIPELCRIFDQLVDTTDESTVDDLMFVLKVLAIYRTEAGTDRVIEAARKPLKPEGYMWSVILGQYGDDHPHAKRVLQELSSPLPPAFLAMALLDCANRHAINGAEMPHPFNSPEGIQRLQAWLTSRDEDTYSYAHSAAASIPFIRRPERDQLLALALDHPSVDVQMEGAWASARVGSEAGLKVLVRYCLDPCYSATACRYLSELGHEEAIPDEAQAPDFRVKAEFANWLSHPNELGRPPDDLEIVDHRELAWPPDGERKPLWLIKYRAKDTTGLENDDVGCGLVGSVTFCLFSYKLEQRPPEDAYAIHCCWELEAQRLIRESNAEEADTKYDAMLQEWQGDPLQGAKIVHVAEISPGLGYPQNAVALAAATRNGEEGWAVLDGPRSTWYPKSEMPEDTYSSIILKIHVGRRLLGFPAQADRRRFLAKGVPRRNPQQIIEAYEKLLTEASTGDEARRKKLLGGWSLLKRHFDTYLDAQVEVHSTARAKALVCLYEKLFAMARQEDDTFRECVADVCGPLSDYFGQYVDAAVAMGQAAKVEAMIEQFAPYWEHNCGYGLLGTAAFKCRRFDLAEKFFVKLRESFDDARSVDEMGMLAEIWHKQGQSDKASELLTDCLKNIVSSSRSATGSDKELFEEWFQNLRATYLLLFADRGDEALKGQGIPSSTLNTG